MRPAAGWYSLINDGDANGTRGTLTGADPLYNAAFPSVYNVSSTMSGRVIDTVAAGGPNMDQFQYPSATGLAVKVGTTTVLPVGCNGKLVGMGAGYKEFLGH